jgi:hypothetical protein
VLVWCSVQLIQFNKVVHVSLNLVHWSQITKLASDLDSVDLRAPIINYFKGSSQTKDKNSANGGRVGKVHIDL